MGTNPVNLPPFFRHENLLVSASISRGVRSEVGGGQVAPFSPRGDATAMNAYVCLNFVKICQIFYRHAMNAYVCLNFVKICQITYVCINKYVKKE